MSQQNTLFDVGEMPAHCQPLRFDAVVPLTRGMFATIDASDLELVSAFKWQAMPSRNTWYAVTTPWESQQQPRKTVRMHRLILGARAGELVDHRDGNGLNNRRDNLRIATNQTNLFNRRPNRKGASRFKGVYRDRSRWRACIMVSGRSISLGNFNDEAEAARAYDAAAIRFQGEFAYLNFSQEAE